MQGSTRVLTRGTRAEIHRQPHAVRIVTLTYASCWQAQSDTYMHTSCNSRHLRVVAGRVAASAGIGEAALIHVCTAGCIRPRVAQETSAYKGAEGVIAGARGRVAVMRVAAALVRVVARRLSVTVEANIARANKAPLKNAILYA